MIPLPTEINDISNSIDGISTVSPNNPIGTKYLYLNQIEIQNSTLIVNYDKIIYCCAFRKKTRAGPPGGQGMF